jgi:hypothetical protein
MNAPVIHIISKQKDLPELDNSNFFHSRQLFEIVKQTPRQRPYMVVATASDGRVLAHMLATVRYRTLWVPPYIYTHCRILGEGVYTYNHEGYSEYELFGQMLNALRSHIGYHVLYIEVSNLSEKMFAYRELKQQEFFPVRWMSIHNSLHSHAPEERLSKKMLKRIEKSYSRGVITDEVKDEADFKAFSQLLHKHNRLKPKRYIPKDDFFRGMRKLGNARLFVTRYHEHIIGCSAVVYSEQQSYLWYTAFRRKTYITLHPDEVTLWHALKDAYDRGYEHMYFMDVGLPYSKNSYREFILRFGGKPVSTYRWFRCNIKWINSLLSWIYRD